VTVAGEVVEVVIVAGLEHADRSTAAAQAAHKSLTQPSLHSDPRSGQARSIMSPSRWVAPSSESDRWHRCRGAVGGAGPLLLRRLWLNDYELVSESVSSGIGSGGVPGAVRSRRHSASLGEGDHWLRQRADVDGPRARRSAIAVGDILRGSPRGV
jgi:hypothetical protein